MSNNKVSVIMPCYNSENHLALAIDSVLAQSYEDWELIICDDNSSDSSRQIAYEYALADKRIICIRNEKTKGAPGARNSCLEYARGRYIAFLDADDIWYSDKLSLQLTFMGVNRCVLSYSHHDVMNEKGDLLCSVKAPRKVTKRKMLFTNYICCATAIYDSGTLGKIYQPDIKKRNDYALWLKILSRSDGLEAHCLEFVTACYRSNSYGLSNGNVFSLLGFYRRCIQDYGGCSNFQSLMYTPIYLLIMVGKKKFLSLYNFLVVRI
jgi:teichuronic acid biosynthesis glycosyltransferase TuaG